jgi:hypothetical protein
MKQSSSRFSVMTGTVMQVDPQGRSLTVQGLVMNKTFDIADNAEISTTENPQADLTDLRPGQSVDVTYEQHHTTTIAHSIRQSAAEYRQAA